LSIEDGDEIGKFPLSHLLKMFVLVRAVTYAALFIGFVLVYLPGRSRGNHETFARTLGQRKTNR